MDSAVTENAWDGKKRAQISQEKELIQSNAAELLAVSGSSPSSVHSYKLPKQILIRSGFKTL